MANRDSSRTTRTRGTYYQPAAEIRSVPGVVKVECDSRIDVYTGTADALVAAGIAPLCLFPGQPGIAATTASYRPACTVASGAWYSTPGYMSIFRNPSGSFRVVLTVSIEEQERRCAKRNEELAKLEAERAMRANAEAARREALRRLEVRTYLARKSLEAATRDEATFRANSQELMGIISAGIIGLVKSKDGTFSYLDADAERITGELAGIYHSLMKLPVRRDPGALGRATAALAAIEDTALQSVLGKLVSGAERGSSIA